MPRCIAAMGILGGESKVLFSGGFPSPPAVSGNDVIGFSVSDTNPHHLRCRGLTSQGFSLEIPIALLRKSGNDVKGRLSLAGMTRCVLMLGCIKQRRIYLELPSLREESFQGVGHALAVESCRDDTTGIAGTLARREQTLYFGMHQRELVARNTHRR